MCFRKMDEFIAKDEAFVKDWLVPQGLEKPADVFKGIYILFLYFIVFICKLYKGQAKKYYNVSLNNFP